MPTAIIIGAGKIGRGFIARNMSSSGLSIVLIDKDAGLVTALNKHGSYPVRVVSPEGISTESIDGYNAMHISQTDEISEAISAAEIITVSVGADNIVDVAKYLAPPLAMRARTGKPPLNILVCENLIGSDKRLRDALEAQWNMSDTVHTHGNVAISAACVGCTAPSPLEWMLRAHPLALLVDDYGELPVAEDTIIGKLPDIKILKPYKQFDYCIRRKLFIHNMGHAVAAYIGHLKGHMFLADAMGDRQVQSLTRGAMEETALALKKAYSFADGLDEYIDGLLALFANRDMGDTLKRIGSDPLRKTAAGDRLSGAYVFCIKHGVWPVCVANGLAAAMRFNAPGDVTAQKMRERIESEGMENFLLKHCGIKPDEISYVKTAFNDFRNTVN